MGSLVFYIVSFVICVLIISAVEKNKTEHYTIGKKGLIFLALLIPIMVSGLRFGVGTDFYTYYYSIPSISNLEISQYLNSAYEIGFILIAHISNFLQEPQVLFIIFSMLTILFVYKGIVNEKEKISIGFAMFIYLFMFFTSSFNGVRQCLAVVIIFYAYRYIVNKQFVKFLFFTLLAMCFHKTAIVMLPFYFIINSNRKIIKFLGVICSILLVICINDIMYIFQGIDIFEKYAEYLNATETGGLGTLIINVAMLVFIALYKDRLYKYNPNTQAYYYLYLIGVLFSILSLKVVSLGRLSSYFTISLVYLLPSIVKVINNKKERYTISILIIGIVISLFIVKIYLLGQGEIIPYNVCIGK